jgi:hypothetical protein
MLGRLLPAALVVAGISTLVGVARAEDALSVAPKTADATIFETSARLRYGWTELALRGNAPKAWDESASPEFRASLRVLAGLFEGKLEAGVVSDRFAHFDDISADSLRGELQLGINTGAWSYLLEWKPRNVLEPEFDGLIARFNVVDAKVKHRFAAELFSGLPEGLFQASLAAGYVAATPEFFERTFAETELELVQRFANGFAVTIAPKLELSDYLDFAGTDRKDAIFSLRIAPTYSFGDGLTLSLEGQATIAVSTLETKSGETWSFTPILRLQKGL